MQRYTRTPIPKVDLTIHKPGEIKQYQLTPDELARYRSMPKQPRYRRIGTTARQYLQAQR